ncbi:MAG: response regulator [Myxococcales bacterium]
MSDPRLRAPEERQTTRSTSQVERTFFEAVLEATPELVAIASADRRLTYMNASGRRLLGIDGVEDISRRTLLDLPASVSTARSVEEMLPRAEHSGSWSGDIVLRHGDGSTVPVFQTLICARRESGPAEAYALIARDLRDRAQLEKALLEASAQLEHARRLEAVGRLAGEFAHDFNNLITVMACVSSLALRKLSPDHPARPEVLELQHVSERATALARQLLTFSRKRASEPRIVEINALLLGLRALMVRVLGEHIELDWRLARDLGRVRIDPATLEQVVVNLVINARDAMPTGGVVTLETENVAPQSSLTERASAPSHYVRINVRDTGVGMGPTTQLRMFEPFFTTKGSKGTGLGLATVHSIIEQNGGFVAVQSEKGVGTSIEVCLPKVADEVTPPRAIEGAREPWLPGQHVLVVDDDDSLRALLTRVLEAEGYHVRSAANAHAARELVEEQKQGVDLLLSDMVMPGPSGSELASALKRRLPALRVIFMSGHLDHLDATNIHGAPLLHKPFPPELLLQTIHELLVPPASAP